MTQGWREPAREGVGLVRWQGLVWTATKARKRTVCAYSAAHIGPGDAIYRPITNGGLRMKRVLASAWEGI